MKSIEQPNPCLLQFGGTRLDEGAVWNIVFGCRQQNGGDLPALLVGIPTVLESRGIGSQ